VDSASVANLGKGQSEGLVPEVTIRSSHRLADILKAFLLQGCKSKKEVRNSIET
jgi:hypothetical protein